MGPATWPGSSKRSGQVDWPPGLGEPIESVKPPPSIQTPPELLQLVQANAYVILPIREFNRLFEERPPGATGETNGAISQCTAPTIPVTAITSRSARILNFCASHKLALRAMRQYCLISRGELNAAIFRDPPKVAIEDVSARQLNDSVHG